MISSPKIRTLHHQDLVFCFQPVLLALKFLDMLADKGCYGRKSNIKEISESALVLYVMVMSAPMVM